MGNGHLEELRSLDDVEDERFLWFDNGDVRNPRVRSWPTEYIEFLSEEISLLPRRNPSVLAANIWILCRSIKDTFLANRIVAYCDECEKLAKKSTQLLASDFMPPIRSHELYEYRNIVAQSCEDFVGFAKLLIDCMDNDLSPLQVVSRAEALLAGDEFYFVLRDMVVGDLLRLLDYAIVDVELGTPLSSGTYLIDGFIDNVLESSDNRSFNAKKQGIDKTAKTLNWGLFFERLTPLMMKVLQVLIDERRKGSSSVSKELIQERAEVTKFSPSDLFKLNRTRNEEDFCACDSCKSRTTPMHQVHVVIEDLGGGSYRIIDPEKVPSKIPSRS